MLQWHTIFCKPHKETQVAKFLQSNEIEMYHPTLTVEPVNPRAAKTRSFFPRYLFIHTDLNKVGMSALNWVPGAVGLVEIGGGPAVIPDVLITELRERIADIEAAGGLHMDGLKHGDRVVIKDGPFSGYEAIFDHRLSGKDRVQVLLFWLGREMKVKLNTNTIEKRRRRH